MKTIVLTEQDFMADVLNIKDPLSITMGVFDGLHRGHQALFAKTLQVGRERGLKSAAITFDFSHVSLEKRKQHFLTDVETRDLLASFGFDYYITIVFGELLQGMTPEAYLQQLTKHFAVAAITVGEDFHFGKNGAGDIATLADYAQALHYELHTVPLVIADDTRISSQAIEQLLRAGDILGANALLGYAYAMTGVVIHGEKKGRQLGYPTANMIIPAAKICLPNGVYVTQVKVDGHIYGGATNIGVSPTIKNESDRIIETYIFDFAEEIYDKEITVYFYKRIRDEEKFANIAELKAQMAKDIRESRAYLSSLGDKV